jgi:hypothetical protein
MARVPRKVQFFGVDDPGMHWSWRERLCS